MIATIDAAKITLPELLEKLQSGDTFVLTRGDAKIPVARVEPIAPVQPAPKRLGALAHLNIDIPDSFFDPLSEEELRLWEGKEAIDPSGEKNAA